MKNTTTASTHFTTKVFQSLCQALCQPGKPLQGDSAQGDAATLTAKVPENLASIVSNNCKHTALGNLLKRLLHGLRKAVVAMPSLPLSSSLPSTEPTITARSFTLTSAPKALLATLSLTLLAVVSPSRSAQAEGSISVRDDLIRIKSQFSEIPGMLHCGDLLVTLASGSFSKFQFARLFKTNGARSFPQLNHSFSRILPSPHLPTAAVTESSAAEWGQLAPRRPSCPAGPAMELLLLNPLEYALKFSRSENTLTLLLEHFEKKIAKEFVTPGSAHNLELRRRNFYRFWTAEFRQPHRYSQLLALLSPQASHARARSLFFQRGALHLTRLLILEQLQSYSLLDREQLFELHTHADFSKTLEEGNLIHEVAQGVIKSFNGFSQPQAERWLNQYLSFYFELAVSPRVQEPLIAAAAKMAQPALACAALQTFAHKPEQKTWMLGMIEAAAYEIKDQARENQTLNRLLPIDLLERPDMNPHAGGRDDDSPFPLLSDLRVFGINEMP